MSSNWQGSGRKDRLPANWNVIRKRILKRDQRMCQWKELDGGRCLASATDVDHIRPGDDHRDSNLQALCQRHHRRKSSSEGGVARRNKRYQISKRYKRTEEHPGMI